MAELKRINVMSVAKVNGVIGVLFGLIAGIFINIIPAGMMSQMGEMDAVKVLSATGTGVMGFIVLPIFYGISGFVVGALFAFLYNLVARWIGGVRLELK